MGLVNIYNLIRNVWTLSAHVFLGITNILLIAWVIVFKMGTDTAVYLSVAILFGIIISGLIFWYQLARVPEFTPFTYIARNVYAFFLGWVAVAFSLGIGILLVYWWEQSN